MTLYINYTLQHICFLFKQLRSVSDAMINRKNRAWIPINASLPSRKASAYLIKLGEKQSSHACSRSSFSLSSPLFISNANRKSMWSSLASPSLTSPSGRGLTSLGATSNPSQLLGWGFCFCGLEKAYLYKWLPYPLPAVDPALVPVGAWFSFLAATDWNWPW